MNEHLRNAMQQNELEDAARYAEAERLVDTGVCNMHEARIAVGLSNSPGPNEIARRQARINSIGAAMIHRVMAGENISD